MAQSTDNLATPQEGLEQRYLQLISGERRGSMAAALRTGLALAELPYRGIMWVRNGLYDLQPERASKLGRPTVSIGNLTAGGTGKTPVVQWLASTLTAGGQQPAILMRGYRKTEAGISDEQTMLQNLLPSVRVEANPDRIAGARAVLANEPATTFFILDDGFQHRRAARNFDLVLIHARQPFGFGHVHPRGLLREPMSGLARASAILITHASEVPPDQLLKTQEMIRLYSDAPLFHCDHVNEQLLPADGSEPRELSDLATTPFLLFTGIGQPGPLAESLRRFPAAYRGERFFDDHHAYSPADIQELASQARAINATTLVTTEKDWVKLAPLWKTPEQLPALYRLGLKIRFWEEEEARLLDCIGRSLGAPLR